MYQYMDNSKKASKIINKHLQNQNFVIFNFIKTINDSLAIRLGWNMLLKLDE